jgi:hypothetical protein
LPERVGGRDAISTRTAISASSQRRSAASSGERYTHGFGDAIVRRQWWLT